MQRLRDEFWQALQAQFGERIALNGHPEHRLPNTINVSFVGHNGAEVLACMPTVAAATGLACHVGSTHIGPELRAMGVPDEAALGAIRFRLGRTTNLQELETVVAVLRGIIRAESASAINL